MTVTTRKSKGFAQRLLDLEEEVIALVDATADARRRRKLSRLRKALSAQAGRLTDEELDAATRDYEMAAAALERAGAATRQAIGDVEAAQKAIDRLARVLDLVSKLAS